MYLFSKKDRLLRYLTALFVMLLGSAGVLTLVLAMNWLTPETKEAKVDYREMSAAPKKKPPKKKKKHEQKRQRPQKSIRKSAPTPVISSAISGLSFDLPQLQAFGLSDAVDQLIGEQAVKDMVMTAESVDVAPEPIYEGTLDYPARARRNNQEGYVVINILINSDGAVEKVKILESVPIGVFDSVTADWARSLKFTPAYYNGKPVKTWARRRIPFQLSR
ncbi:MAG: energy transducer TonB [Deltaproteobacteria bacterium]|nr:energy transducer TonB [Deltaproteobacteria bacterium]